MPVRAPPPEGDDRRGVALVLTTIPVYLSLGSEFMPPLREGTILYMPSAVEPGMSVAEAQKALQIQDKILRTFPEVERVFGKAGRANTSTDPAPFTMMETTVILKPESRVAREAALVLVLGARVAEGRCCARSGATASRRRSSRTR